MLEIIMISKHIVSKHILRLYKSVDGRDSSSYALLYLTFDPESETTQWVVNNIMLYTRKSRVFKMHTAFWSRDLFNPFRVGLGAYFSEIIL
jgi:hypothetical protein